MHYFKHNVLVIAKHFTGKKHLYAEFLSWLLVDLFPQKSRHVQEEACFIPHSILVSLCKLAYFEEVPMACVTISSWVCSVLTKAIAVYTVVLK